MATLGWIGAGDIGLPMLLRLLQAGHEVHVWGRNRERLLSVLEAGAHFAASPQQLMESCEAVFLCVTDTDAVERVVFDAQGILAGASPGKLLIDHSTIHPQRSRAMAEQLRRSGGMGWLDAPVSGGRKGAQDGTLAVFVGGEAAHLQRAQPWIKSYAARITHVGASGAGQITKTCNQAVLCATLAAWAEVLNYAQRCEVDVATVVGALEGSWSDSTVRRLHVPHMISGDYPPGSAALMLKDLDIVGDMAHLTRSPMPMAAIVTTLFRQQIAKGADASGPIGIMRVYHEGPLNTNPPAAQVK